MSLTEDERKNFEKDTQGHRDRRQHEDRRAAFASPSLASSKGSSARRLTDEDGTPASTRTRSASSWPSRRRSSAASTSTSADRGRGQVSRKPSGPTSNSGPQWKTAIDERDRKLNSMKRGDELRSGVLQMVKVYVATKRVISVGDKMASASREQGCHLEGAAPRRTCRTSRTVRRCDILVEPAGRAVAAMNVGQIPRDAPRLGRQRRSASKPSRPCVRWCDRGGDQRSCLHRADVLRHGKARLLRRPHRRSRSSR